MELYLSIFGPAQSSPNPLGFGPPTMTMGLAWAAKTKPEKFRPVQAQLEKSALHRLWDGRGHDFSPRNELGFFSTRPEKYSGLDGAGG